MSRHTRTAALLMIAGSPVALSAHAAVIPWNNPAGGMATIGANWSGGVAPVAADTAVFPALAGPYTVTFPAGFPAITTWNASAGAIAWSLTAAQSTGSVRIANDLVSTPVVTITGNTLTATAPGGAVGLGNVAGTGSGTLNIQGGAVVRTTAANGDITIGVTGNGFLNVSGGGRAEAADDVSIANNSGSTGQASVEGAGSTIATTSATTGDVVVALNGAGTLNVTGLGVVSAAHDLAMGVNSGSNGTVNVTDNDFPGTITVGNNCDIGRNITAASSAGTGLLALSGPSAVSVTVSQSTTVGDPDGGSGTLQMNGGTFTTRALTFDPVNSTFTFNNGLLVVSGGVFTPKPGQLTINGGAVGQLPTLRLSNGASCTATGGISVGANRSGRMEVLSGATATGVAGAITIGSAASGIGSVLVDGAGSSINQTGSTIFAGFGGNGTLLVQNGGVANCAAGRVAQNVGSLGAATISGGGSRWDMGSILAIGGSSSAVGGTGTCTFENGAVGTASHLILWPGSTFNLNNATFTAVAEATLDGTTTITNGTLVASELLESNTTDITASGRMNMKVSNAAASNARIALNGPLDIGPSFSGDNFDWSGRLEVGVHALSIRDLLGVGFQTSRLGDVTINGGSITPISPNRGTALANGDSLIGTGTINGNIEINGGATVTATGANGLTFNGFISPQISPTFTITGTRVNIGASGGVTGAGAINAQFLASAGAVITATGDLSLGSNLPIGYGLTGATLNVGAHTITLVDTNGGSIGLAHLDGGTITLSGSLVSGANLNTAQNGHLTGHGRTNSPIFSNLIGGQISPGAGADATGVGTITINGDYRQSFPPNTPGTLNTDLAGPNAGEFDYLRVAGGATLGGTLNVSLINGYIPQPGVFHAILTTDTGSITGDFAVKNLPTRFIALVDSNTYRVGLPCVADVDDGSATGAPDGGVTIDDLLYYLAIFEAGDLAADVDDGSFTGTLDGGVTIDDLLYYLFRFEAGC